MLKYFQLPTVGKDAPYAVLPPVPSPNKSHQQLSNFGYSCAPVRISSGPPSYAPPQIPGMPFKSIGKVNTKTNTVKDKGFQDKGK